MRKKHNSKNIYAVYDKDDMIESIGTVKEIYEHIGLRPSTVYAKLCKQKKGIKHGRYIIYCGTDE